MTRLNKRIIKNFDSLVNHGQSITRRDALEMIEAGILGADPGRGTFERVRREGDFLFVEGNTYDLRQVKRIYVLGAGKGSFPIAEALDSILGDRIQEGFVVVKKGEKRRLRYIDYSAGHPFPMKRALPAAGGFSHRYESQAGIRFCRCDMDAPPGHAPPAQIPLAEIKELTNLLLALARSFAR